MNTAGVMDMLTDKDPETGEHKIPRIIYSDSYASEMTAYADLDVSELLDMIELHHKYTGSRVAEEVRGCATGGVQHDYRLAA